jgi:hypothetical protein
MGMNLDSYRIPDSEVADYGDNMSAENKNIHNSCMNLD